MLSLIIPIYKNSDSLKELLNSLTILNKKFNKKIEFVFVIDGNPENEYEILKLQIPKYKIKSQLILHSRNFGSFAAIKTGMEFAKGEYFCTMAADLQEPINLIEKIFIELQKNKSDIVIAKRLGREDGLLNTFFSNIFWSFYKKFVIKDIPVNGVDLFGCNKIVRNTLVSLKEKNSSLIGLLFWIGFKRQYVEYKRANRKYGKSAWGFKRKFQYMLDSIFSFTDLPVSILILIGIFGILISVGLSIYVLISRLSGDIKVPGYTATFLIVSFFSSLNILSFGIIGSYIWRTFQNTQSRPNSIVKKLVKFS